MLLLLIFIEHFYRAENLKGLPELHDRMIVASARLLNAELITRDTAIIESGEVKVAR